MAWLRVNRGFLLPWKCRGNATWCEHVGGPDAVKVCARPRSGSYLALYKSEGTAGELIGVLNVCDNYLCFLLIKRDSVFHLRSFHVLWFHRKSCSKVGNDLTTVSVLPALINQHETVVQAMVQHPLSRGKNP